MTNCEHCGLEHKGVRPICGEAMVVAVRDARERAEAVGLSEGDAWAVAELAGVTYFTQRMVEDAVHPAAYDAALARADEVTAISDPDRRRAVLIAYRMAYQHDRMRTTR